MEIQRRSTFERETDKDSGRERLLDRVLRKQDWMDGTAEVVQGWVGGAYGVLGRPGRALKNALHGTTVLGHPLHPAITDVPLGAWTVAVIADWLAIITHRVPTSVGDIALAIGLTAALLAALSGYTDFHETFGQERRNALLHGLTMTTTVVVFAVSLGLRWWGPESLHLAAVILASGAYLLAMGGSYVGGHMTFGLGTMVNRNAFADGPADFVAIGATPDFREGQMRRVDAGGLPVLVTRLNGKVCAIGAVCSHAGGPLEEGKLEGEVVTCPWHGSRFNVCSGDVKGGPASFDQPPLIAREQNGRVEVKLAHPLH
ncbi:MAG TPA: Rieske 2Fe-2S domain-containing protein [Gaiellales bacterium]|nr:Rieske 2Fe-2S domain-containing protein [Gaiellales bacterium]